MYKKVRTNNGFKDCVPHPPFSVHAPASRDAVAEAVQKNWKNDEKNVTEMLFY